MNLAGSCTGQGRGGHRHHDRSRTLASYASLLEMRRFWGSWSAGRTDSRRPTAAIGMELTDNPGLPLDPWKNRNRARRRGPIASGRSGRRHRKEGGLPPDDAGATLTRLADNANHAEACTTHPHATSSYDPRRSMLNTICEVDRWRQDLHRDAAAPRRQHTSDRPRSRTAWCRETTAARP
jgi:hypothetical protein